MTPENRAFYEIMNYLRSLKIFAWKVDSVGIFDPVRKVYRKNVNPFRILGVSDILGILHGGKLLAIEVKRPRRVRLDGKVLAYEGKASIEQLAFLVEINRLGGVGFVATTWLDVEREFKTRGVL